MILDNDRVFTGKARLRARDIREAAKGKNIDPWIVQTLETLAEQDGTLRQQIEMLADLLNRNMDNTLQLQLVIGKAIENIDLLKQTDAVADAKQVAMNRIKLTDGE